MKPLKPYFSHDEGARNDPKLVRVMMRLGQAGKGVYWDLVEMLHEQGGYLPLGDLESMAFGLRTDLPTLTSLLNDFGLFSQDAERFWSETALTRLQMRNAKAEARAAAGAKGGKAKAEKLALLQQDPSIASQEPSNATALSAETLASKVKESKGDTITPDAEPASPSSAVSASLPPVEPCHLTAQNGGKSLLKTAARPGPAFDEFWQAFAKKEDKHKASKAWAALDAAQRTAALEAVASYVAGTPDKRYRKNPLTWLNGKCWLDEETPASRQAGPALPQPAPQLAPPAPAPAINHEFIAQQAAAEAARQAAHFAKFTQPQSCSPPLAQPA